MVMVFVYGYLIVSLFYSMYIYLWATKNKEYQDLMSSSEIGDGMSELIYVVASLVTGLVFPVDISNRIKNKIKKRKGE